MGREDVGVEWCKWKGLGSADGAATHTRVPQQTKMIHQTR